MIHARRAERLLERAQAADDAGIVLAVEAAQRAVDRAGLLGARRGTVKDDRRAELRLLAGQQRGQTTAQTEADRADRPSRTRRIGVQAGDGGAQHAEMARGVAAHPAEQRRDRLTHGLPLAGRQL